LKENEKSYEVTRYFLENTNAKDFFDEVMSIREQIREVNDEEIKIKADQLLHFKKTFEAHKRLYGEPATKSSIHNDLIYSALFRNSTSI